MEGVNSGDTTTEYVIQVEEGGVLQNQDLNHIVSSAIGNSSGNQVYAIYEDGTIAAVNTTTEPDGVETETAVASPLQQEVADQNENTVSVRSDTNSVEGPSIAMPKTSDQLHALYTYGPNTRPSIPKIPRQVHVLNVDTATGHGSVTSGETLDMETSSGQKQTETSERKREKKETSNLPIEVAGSSQNDVIAVQPFTAETIKKSFPTGRAYNTTKTIYDLMMYDKYPPGYTNNQKQALNAVKENYIIVDKKLYYRFKKGKVVRLLLVIHDEEADLKVKILEDCHMTKSGSHNGMNRTVTQIKDYFFWHGLTDHVRAFVKSCQLCYVRYTVMKEKEMLLKVKLDSIDVPHYTEFKLLSETLDKHIVELRRLQKNIKPFESSDFMQTLKNEIAVLNNSIASHLEINKTSSGDISGETISDSVIESAQVDSTENDREDNAGGNDDSEGTGRSLIGKEAEKYLKGPSEVEGLKKLEAMMPRKRCHNHSRLIEDIIRTNKYPKCLTAGQISGLAQVKTHFLMVNDELYRVFSKRGKMLNVAKVIHDDEPELKKKVMKVCHVEEDGRHHGMNKTINRANESFYWQSISMHVKMFLEYCPVCRSRRGLNKVLNSYVAKDISGIISKIATEPKAAQEVNSNLDLTQEDYQEVRKLAQEVKDLNEWLFKNPTIKDEWEHMFEKTNRGLKYDYEETGRHIDKETTADCDMESFIKSLKKGQNVKRYVSILGNMKNVPAMKDASTETETLMKNNDNAKSRDSKKLDSHLNLNEEKTFEASPKLEENTNKSGNKDEDVDDTSDDEIPWSVSLDENGDEVIEDIDVDQNSGDDLVCEITVKDKIEHSPSLKNDTKDNKNDLKATINDSVDSRTDKNVKIRMSDSCNELVNSEEGTFNLKTVNNSNLQNKEINEKGDTIAGHEHDLTGNTVGMQKAANQVTNIHVQRMSKRLESKIVGLDVKKGTSAEPLQHQEVAGQEEIHNTGEETGSELPLRKSARKRTLTHKLSELVRSECAENQTGFGSVRSKVLPADAAKDNSNTRNFKEKINEKNLKREATHVKQMTEQDLSDKVNNSGSGKVRKPIMKSTNVIVFARKLRSESDKSELKKKVMLMEEKDCIAEGVIIGRRSKGIIMKNSDVHVVKRKIKEDQISHMDFCKKRRVSSEDVLSEGEPKRNQVRLSSGAVYNVAAQGPDCDKKTEWSLVPRTRKSNVGLKRQKDVAASCSERVNIAESKQLASDSIEKVSDSQYCSQNKIDFSKPVNEQEKRDTEPVKNLKQLGVIDCKPNTSHEMVRNSMNTDHKSVRSAEKSLKPNNINVDETEVSFQKQYKKFITRNRTKSDMV